MGIKQNQVGHKTETKIAQFFSKYSYWAFVIPKGINGQPFDIIARRKNITFFVDAKHLDSDFFPFDRIEPNQISSMKYAEKIAEIKDNMGFIINKDEEFYFLPYNIYNELKEQGHRGINVKNLEPLNEYLERVENGSNNIK